MTNITEMTIDEFREEYMQSATEWDFTKFTITCNKCGSHDIEFGGRTQLDDTNCFYPSDIPDVINRVVCKCHHCGNAMSFSLEHEY